jgi:hypothetical protein
VVAAVATYQLAARRRISLVIAVALVAGVDRRTELAVLVTRHNEAQSFTFVLVIGEEANRPTLDLRERNFDALSAANLDAARMGCGNASAANTIAAAQPVSIQ